jgi:hypothetical protein
MPAYASFDQIVKQIAEKGLVDGEPKGELVDGISASWGDIMADLVVKLLEKRHVITIKKGMVYLYKKC